MFICIQIYYYDETNKKIKDEVNIQKSNLEKRKFMNTRNIIKANIQPINELVYDMQRVKGALNKPHNAPNHQIIGTQVRSIISMRAMQ